MPILGFLGHAMALILAVIGLLSGVLSVIREIQLMYRPAIVQKKRVFWAFVRIAFVISGIVLWMDEHNKVVQLSKEKPMQPIHVVVGQPESKLLTTTAHVDFGTIVDGGCSRDQSIELKGATARDSPKPGWSSDFPRGVYGDMFVSKDDTVSARICNLSGHPVTYNSVLVRATIVK